MKNINETRSIAGAEKTLGIIAVLLLWVGIAASAALLVMSIVPFSDYEEGWGMELLFAIIPVLSFSVMTWGVLRVICNISNSFREINSKTK